MGLNDAPTTNPQDDDHANSAAARGAAYRASLAADGSSAGRTSVAAERNDRYGNSKVTLVSSRLLIVGIVLMVMVCGFYIWRQYSNSTAADVTISSAGWEKVSDNQLNFTVDVTRDDTSKPAYCIVYALDYDKNEVGRREFVIAADAAATQRYTVPVPTREAAVAGMTYGCSSTIPSYLQQ